jgi:hypothetical protein
VKPCFENSLLVVKRVLSRVSVKTPDEKIFFSSVIEFQKFGIGLALNQL